MRITWGDSVRVKAEAPAELRPGDIGAVVAITGEGAHVVYTIEFGDGTDSQIAEHFLEPFVA
jgi:hypothetical protein